MSRLRRIRRQNERVTPQPLRTRRVWRMRSGQRHQKTKGRGQGGSRSTDGHVRAGEQIAEEGFRTSQSPLNDPPAPIPKPENDESAGTERNHPPKEFLPLIVRTLGPAKLFESFLLPKNEIESSVEPLALFIVEADPSSSSRTVLSV